MQYHTTEMIHNLRPTHEVLSKGQTKSATVRNHEYCQKTETIQSRKQNRNKWIKTYAMQATENADFQNRKLRCRRKQIEGYKRGNSQSSIFKTGLQTELNKDLSIKFNGITVFKIPDMSTTTKTVVY